ncbi:DUF7662 domain-containing protein [Rhabdothermincola salaria]|uniref:DUF7662 domain-containing protein n=1 Tax=Rhabdothermincola salaria TaxID=2903142 RepID=UPI001E34435E|nr:hypothetical protein [Rhabdothermincola salaria]MCD9625630.1 hypothetical protein [Rhabdothermincola salaria]
MAKYDPLHEHLVSKPDSLLKLSFSEIERIFGEPLPASARKHQAWWANESDGSHVEARAWLDAGYRTQGLDLNSETIEFVRG